MNQYQLVEATGQELYNLDLIAEYEIEVEDEVETVKAMYIGEEWNVTDNPDFVTSGKRINAHKVNGW